MAGCGWSWNGSSPSRHQDEQGGKLATLHLQSHTAPPFLSTSSSILCLTRSRVLDGMNDRTRRQQQAKEFDDPMFKKSLSEYLIPHLLNLYGSRATARDFEIYAPNATFEDPLMCAHGVKQIKSAFYSLSKVFSESRIVEYSIQENVIAPGNIEMLIDNKQHYKIFGRDVDLTSLIKLNIVEGKVVRHEDWWDKKPLKNKDTVKLPLVGRLAEVTRRGSMLVTHAMMGFGKDPST